jgi:hypothetical protein
MNLRSSIAPQYREDFIFSACIQTFFLIAGALCLDGGGMLRYVLIVIATYWAMSLIIVFRRPLRPTRSDLWVVRHGFLLVMIIIAPVTLVVTKRLLGHL